MKLFARGVQNGFPTARNAYFRKSGYTRPLPFIESLLLIVVLSIAAAPPGLALDEPKREGLRSFTVISPIFRELVAYSLPATFVTAYEKTLNDYYIREAVLRGETVDHWTEMITVTGKRGLAANPAIKPENLAADIALRFENSCPTSFSVNPLGRRKISEHDAFLAVVRCGAMEFHGERHSEATLIVVVRGTSDFYTVQWAERGEPAEGALPFDEAKWRARFDRLSPIRVCPIVAGEKTPYPSCIGGGPYKPLPPQGGKKTG